MANIQQVLSSDRLATKDMGQKVLREELGLHLTRVAWAEAYRHAKFHFDPSNRLAAIHQRHSQTGQTTQTTVR